MLATCFVRELDGRGARMFNFALGSPRSVLWLHMRFAFGKIRS